MYSQELGWLHISVFHSAFAMPVPSLRNVYFIYRKMSIGNGMYHIKRIEVEYFFQSISKKSKKKAGPEMDLPFKYATPSLAPYIISTKCLILSSSSGLVI